MNVAELIFTLRLRALDVESFAFGFRPFGLLLKTGDVIGINFNSYEDGVREPFGLTDEVTIGAGRYRYHDVAPYINTFRGRRLQLEFSPRWGTFFGGRKVTYATTITANFSKHFNVEVDHTWNELRFAATGEAPATRLETNELALYPTYTFTTNLTVSVFAQWNSLNEFVRINARLHWIPRIGTDLFLVLDQSHDTSDRFDLWMPRSRSLVGKLVWRFVF